MSSKHKELTAKEFIKKKEVEWEIERKEGGERGFKDIGREGRHYFFREAWTFMQQHNNPEKVFVIERLKKSRTDGKLSRAYVRKKGVVEYRFGYFIVGKIGNKKGRWTWGQYCPLIPEKDLKVLLRKAKKDKTIG